MKRKEKKRKTEQKRKTEKQKSREYINVIFFIALSSTLQIYASISGLLVSLLLCCVLNKYVLKKQARVSVRLRFAGHLKRKRKGEGKVEMVKEGKRMRRKRRRRRIRRRKRTRFKNIFLYVEIYEYCDLNIIFQFWGRVKMRICQAYDKRKEEKKTQTGRYYKCI